MEQDLRGGRVLLPHQTHVYRLGALHRDQRGDLAADRRISDGVTRELLSKHTPSRNEAQDTENPGEPYYELRETLTPSFHRASPLWSVKGTLEHQYKPRPPL